MIRTPRQNGRKPLHPVHDFQKKIRRSLLFSFGLMSFSVGLGMVGYHLLGKLNWVDSLLNASMILTGMGPVDKMPNDAAKLFSSFYALYSGVAFLSIFAVFFAPIFHRFLHQLNVDLDELDRS
ncbi:MAG: hypothetical protein ACOVOL_02865 [Bacteroidia bacterium]|jgi:hypothetical protein